TRAASRRIYLYAVIGISIIILVAGLVNIVYQVLNGILGGNFDIGVLRDSRWSIQLIVIGTPILWYHWLILRTDQKTGAEVKELRKTAILVTDTAGDSLTNRLQEKLNMRIRTFYRLDQQAEPVQISDEELDSLITEMQSTPADRFLIMVRAGKASLVPYREK
ncbi:MAG: DUF5671 domain-containing protein, partial [Nitrospira sp.]|nr:DUF5671 domain-containing protein [Nitrospira sp.]